MEKTLADTEPRYLELIMGLNDAAYARMDAPDFVRVLPPPEDKTPGNLIYAWGVEMLRQGFELALELFEETQGGQEDAHGK